MCYDLLNRYLDHVCFHSKVRWLYSSKFDIGRRTHREECLGSVALDIKKIQLKHIRKQTSCLEYWIFRLVPKVQVKTLDN